MPGINEIIVAKKWNAPTASKLASQQQFIDYPRIPTNIFPVDYVLAGGIPCNVISQIYGPQHGGKSTFCYLAAKALSSTCMRCLKPFSICECPEPNYIEVCPKCGKPAGTCKCKYNLAVERCGDCGRERIACSCRSRLKQKTFLAHFEGLPPDGLYFSNLGYYDADNIFVASPDYGEQGCNMIETAAKSDDVGLIIVDSLANIVPGEELECDYEDAKVALQARLIARLFRRLTNVLVTEFRRGHMVSVLFINQMRSIIGGGKFAPSETTPGGHASKHGYRLSMRHNQLSGDSKSGEVTTDGEKYVLRFSVSLLGAQSKQQLLVLHPKCEYKIVIDSSYRDVPVGTCIDSTTVVTVAKKLGILEKLVDKYVLKGTDMDFERLSDIDDMFIRDPAYADAFRYHVVQVARKRKIDRILADKDARLAVCKSSNGKEA